MTDRSAEIAQFLTTAGWNQSMRCDLAGDASSRRYERVTRHADAETAILMDSATQAVGPFLRVTALLRQSELSAPKVFAEDQPAGLLLLEDLGDDTFSRLIADNPRQETTLYTAAVDSLMALQTVPTPDEFTRFNSAEMASLTALAFETYAAPFTPKNSAPDMLPRLRDLFADLIPDQMVFAHRDFHADNLIWLPSRSGVKQVGMLDYQDAVAAHPAYDLVSLLQDARRDVPQVLAKDMLRRFADATGATEQDLQATYAALGLQRNLRILGVFARLAQTQGKTRYLTMLPRVYAYVRHNLGHPKLEHLAEPLQMVLPEPTPAVLARLREVS